MTQDEATHNEIATQERPKGMARLEAGLAADNGILAPERWQMLSAIAETVHNTEFVPAALRGSPPKVLAALLYGDSQGMHPMVALKEIHVIEGRPTMSAARMVGQVRERGHKISRSEVRGEDGSFKGITVHGERADTGETDSYTFTLEMAARAGLMTKKNWQHYPEAMCFHRAASQLCTFLFSDVFGGSPYTPEELEETEPLGAGDLAEPGDRLGRDGPAFPAEEIEPSALIAVLDETGSLLMKMSAVEANDYIDGKLTIAELEGYTIANYDAEAVYVHPEILEGDVEPEPAVEAVGAAESPSPADDQQEAVETAEAPAGAASDAPTEEAKDGQISLKIGGKPPSDHTVADVLKFAEAAPPEWIEGYLDYETKHRARGSLVNALVKLLEAKRGQKMPPVHDETSTIPSPPVEQVVDEIKDASAEAEANGNQQPAVADEQEPAESREASTAGSAPLSFQPTAEPEPEPEVEGRTPAERLLMVKIKAACAWMNDQHPDQREWRYEAVVASAGRLWQGELNRPVHSLDDLDEWMLEMIWTSVPDEAKQGLAIMEDQGKLEAFAERAI